MLGGLCCREWTRLQGYHQGGESPGSISYRVRERRCLILARRYRWASWSRTVRGLKRRAHLLFLLVFSTISPFANLPVPRKTDCILISTLPSQTHRRRSTSSFHLSFSPPSRGPCFRIAFDERESASFLMYLSSLFFRFLQRIVAANDFEGGIIPRATKLMAEVSLTFLACLEVRVDEPSLTFSSSSFASYSRGRKD